MPLPSDPNFRNIARERPGDEVYAGIKEYITKFDSDMPLLKDKFVKLILEDMLIDRALSEAIDAVGVILEYQGENDGIETPKFEGTILMKDVSRVSRLAFAVQMAKLLDLSDSEVDMVLRAEADRLWFDPKTSPPRESKADKPSMTLPEEVTSILRDISKLLRRDDGKHGTRKSSGSAVSPAAKPESRARNK